MWRRSRATKPNQWEDRSGRPRVLVEDRLLDGPIRASYERFLQREGFDVAVCRGPATLGAGGCPVLACNVCPLAAGADVIYMSLPWELPANRDVLRAHQQRHPRTPVLVEISGAGPQGFTDLPTSSRLVPGPSGRMTVLGAVRDALADGMVVVSRTSGPSATDTSS